ncbi:large subunit ribosomal protein L6e, cytoplasmic [Guillardia theta CCMP2712]|uniref:Large subunit ribosomal protein L6e, cytoplasmic n=2 Tax=Guillardia theta TaxID=55529 RepID=L1IS67_GUITC|nr:large subunit ribosomal protein L6e, cytoplasmic [Guillardia theta CCMP2712]EKX38670.1 large subunit ribosomal protein L6e, cytoplasmic [Guillardia theta CCMP2712]|eukprot:XP_005825650.1 large subunit ribosomal protein L6e, cytoplasmic [Guillardia theta CCMP2712]
MPPKRSVSRAKKIKNVALKRVKIGKKAHAPSAPVGRSASYHRSGKWAVKAKNGGKFPVHPKQKKEEEKKTACRYYPAEDIPQPLRRRNVNKAAKLKANYAPGTILILLSGRFRGRRVVFLKQLEKSGLLLVTGPYKYNGVPLRRVNQAYCIATSASVSLDGVNLDKFNDQYFEKVKTAKPKNADGFFATDDAKKELSPERKADQKTVDTPIIAAMKKTEFLKPYVSSRFTLSKGQAPHTMVF